MKKLLLSFGVALLLSSCATIFTGTKDRISFNSNPQGAIIYKDGVELCTTPCSYKVKRSISDTDIEIKLDGYQTRLITLDKEFNVVSILNLGNLIGWGIDAVSGAVLKYDRKTYDLTLTKEKVASITEVNRVNFDTEKNTADIYVMQD